ncbi:MAG: epoxyqueuosine reductase QueH [Campylobacteraceae bacterium]|jgi:predicted adenine nucleotide alpha hydrolase (AANH) superfamily ATPase|nr:epoxyqueuosine reductase QueH [Campylobacteraceae bacterium]
MLAHICCSVDSHYFLKKLREGLPDEDIIGFFYNPNIHPYEEYELRLLDVKRSCEKYDIKLLEGEYDFEGWREAVKGLECEKERGKRCEVCFEARLEASAKKAKELGQKRVTTTLFMSPKKSFEQLSAAAEKIGKKEGVEVLCFDFRKKGGTQEQFKLAREDRLYHQNYCGCMYALNDQRAAKDRVTDELMSPISNEILYGSIAERTKLYKKVWECEKGNLDFRIEREKFHNYRLLWGRVLKEGEAVHSFFVGEYDFSGEPLEAKVVEVKDGLGFTGSDMLFLSLKRFNEITRKSYKSVKELIYSPITRQEHLDVERKLADFLPIIVLENVEKATYKIEAKSTNYQDVREVLAIL